MDVIQRASCVFAAVFMVFLTAGSIGSLSGIHTDAEVQDDRQEASEGVLIERALFDLANKERQSRGYPLLKSSGDLIDLARSHSRDMAEQRYFSHDSPSGKTYQDRLIQGGVFFRRAGENIAFSETYVSDLIHQSLMDSQEHREEILTPEYDHVGVGVFKDKEGVFYITQDFIKILVPLESGDAEKLLQERINKARIQQSIPPLQFLDYASLDARKYSRQRVNQVVRPRVGNRYGETHVDFVIANSLDSDLIYKRSLSAAYEDAGVGVHFSRNKENPGGAYFITLFLFLRNRYSNASPDEWSGLVLEAVNSFRRERGLADLVEDRWLSSEAGRLSKRSTLRTPQLQPSRQDRLIFVNSYITNDPSRLPDPVPRHLDDPSVKRIGIGVFFGKPKDMERELFSILLIIST